MYEAWAGEETGSPFHPERQHIDRVMGTDFLGLPPDSAADEFSESGHTSMPS